MKGMSGLVFPDTAFETRLREVLQSQVEFIELIGEDLVTAGGKRTRPLITLLVAQALGYSTNHPHWNKVLDVSVCVELLHSASLLHDDLIDDSQTRRGNETAFRRFGNVVSVMSGDFMLARLLMLLAEMHNGAALTKAFGHTSSVICEGEVLQFQIAAYADYAITHYLKIIHGKTAALIELAATAPAMLLQAKEQDIQALRTFGLEYGMAFQMQDDLLDLTSTEEALGKPVGSDLREGKATYPVLLLLEESIEENDEVRQILERQAKEPEDITRVQELVSKYQTAEATRTEIRRRAQCAVKALEQLAPSPARDALSQLAQREIERAK